MKNINILDTDVKQFQLECDVFMRKHGEPIDVARESLKGLIDSLQTCINRPSQILTESIFTPEARSNRKFESECERLNSIAQLKYFNCLLSNSHIAIRRGMAIYGGVKLSVINSFCTELLEYVMPKLEELSNPGDLLAIFTEMTTKYNDFFDLAVNLAVQETSPYENLSGCLAIMGLVVQAKRLYAASKHEEAWINLIDASFFVGAQKGTELSRKIFPAVEKKLKAIKGGRKKNESTEKLKRNAIALYTELKPVGAWENASFATDKIYPLIVIEASKLSTDLEAKGKKRISLGKKIIHQVCHDLYRLDNQGVLFRIPPLSE